MRILVTGAAGMLGREVVKMLADEGRHFIAFEHREFDISDEWRVAAIKDLNVDTVINCAGIVKGRDEAPSRYVAVNALGPHMLAEACDRCGARLIHVSTDCVFSGRHGGYSEAAIPDPLDLYGRSKLLGEVTNGPHLTVRTSFIGFGPRGLLSWLLKQQGGVPGYSHAFWNGLPVAAVARVLVALAGRRDITGLLHLGGESMSKWELLHLVVQGLCLPIKVEDAPPTLEQRYNRCLWTERRDLQWMYDLIPHDVFAMVDELAAEWMALRALGVKL